MTKPDHLKARVRKPQEQIVSIDEAVSRHAGQWILMRVGTFDADRNPETGNILVSAPGEQLFHKRLRKVLPLASLPDEHYYLFVAHPHGRTAGDLQAGLQEAVREEGMSAGRR